MLYKYEPIILFKIIAYYKMDIDNSDKGLVNFLRVLDSKERIGRQVAFVEIDKKLDSAVSFTQYIFNNKKLITVIGERHNNSFKCDERSLSIDFYCKMAVERNPKCIVMLEYEKGSSMSLIGSKVIIDTYNLLTKSGYTEQIIPFEYRHFFLGVGPTRKLYAGFDEYIDNNNLDKIYKDFIEPFYRHQECFNLKSNDDYDPNLRSYLTQSYFDDIKNDFKIIEAKLKQPELLGEIHQSLKDVWKKITDYFILQQVFKNDDIDEYIIIAGEAHSINLNLIFPSVGMLLINNQLGKEKNNCVNLYQTYLL
jgi:hypothetical protein